MSIPSQDTPLSHGDSGRILIVDDNPTNLDVLFNFLANQGYEVFVAEDGKSALERMELAKPDLVLLDIMMPEMDGFETCQEIKKNASTADIPVIYVTALGGVSDKVKGFDTGAVDYITKPFRNKEVLARVRTHLSLKRARQELIRNNERLREQNESLEAYAHTVAHDLKNPLNVVLNFASLLKEEPGLSPQTLEDLGYIIESARRMNHIIHDLLLLAQIRIEDVRPAPVPMSPVADEVLSRLRMEIESTHANVTLPREWMDAMGIAPWIQAVWVNFVSNAMKYGGSPPQIELTCAADPERPGFVRYGVSDNGPGIPPEEMRRIFKEFSRVGGSKAEGHGIGLSICRRILRKLGGDVGVENHTDSPGCTFYFVLPGIGGGS